MTSLHQLTLHSTTSCPTTRRIVTIDYCDVRKTTTNKPRRDHNLLGDSKEQNDKWASWWRWEKHPNLFFPSSPTRSLIILLFTIAKEDMMSPGFVGCFVPETARRCFYSSDVASPSFWLRVWRGAGLCCRRRCLIRCVIFGRTGNESVVDSIYSRRAIIHRVSKMLHIRLQ